MRVMSGITGSKMAAAPAWSPLPKRAQASTMDRPAGTHTRSASASPAWLHPFPHAALAQQNVRQRMLRPGIAHLELERVRGAALGVGKVAAQLRCKGRHPEKIRVVGIRVLDAPHVRAEPRAHVLLAEHVIQKLRQLRGEQICRPLLRDGFHGLDRAKVIVGPPQPQRNVHGPLAFVGARAATQNSDCSVKTVQFQLNNVS